MQVGSGQIALSAPVVIDSGTSSSEVWITGAGGTKLEMAGGGAAFVVRGGAPTVHLENLDFAADLSVRIEGGQVNLRDCLFANDDDSKTDGDTGRRLAGSPERALTIVRRAGFEPCISLTTLLDT